MAIYHFSAKVISRAAGSSALAAAAYRSGSRLHDVRLERDHDFTRKSGVVHSEVLLPDGAPPELGDRERLWNAVEAAEVRRDAQLAREVEFALPRELTVEQGADLARDFVAREFVSRGMVADLNVHWDRLEDGSPKPHAHVMLTMREVKADGGFEKKVREWNRTELLQVWRERWAERVNDRLAELDLDVRVDHRSLEAQGLDLEPQHKIGAAGARREYAGEAAERAEDHHRIARENGERLLARPEIALDAITRQQATFTDRDLQLFVHRHSHGREQFERVLGAVRASPELVRLGRNDRSAERFTSREMVAVEQRLERAASGLARDEGHAVSGRSQDLALARAEARGLRLSGEQRLALEHVTGTAGLSAVVGVAGAGKSAMLGVAREAWEDAGLTVQGAALSGIAAENLEGGSGIASRTLASLEHGWAQGRDVLTARDVLVIDEAGMVGSRQMERVLSAAQDAGAKVVLVGDPEQLQAIEAGAAFRSIVERHGAVEITEVRRQREAWQRDATRDLATGRTAEALEAYTARGAVHSADTREEARRELIEGWDRERRASPDANRLILTHTNDEVRELNAAARDCLRRAGELGEEVRIGVERGERGFAAGDRVMFLRNERSLEVKNGTLGTLETVSPQRLAVRLDDGRSVAFDLKDYANLDHGYAATVHKAQGVTVDRAHVLGTPGLDRHAAYVALSRHREGVDLHYGRDDFADRQALARMLGRERAKDMASDYAHDVAERRGLERPGRGGAAAGVAPGPALHRGLDPERERSRVARAAFQRHARAVAAIFQAQESGLSLTELDEKGWLAGQREELGQARRGLDAFDPHHSRDVERAYRADPALAYEAAGGNIRRAVQAMRLGEELRLVAPARAERFVARWTKLDAQRVAAYRAGDIQGERAVRNSMGEMARGLERDAQVESLLAARKSAQLGIGGVDGNSLTRRLAISIGFDLGRGRGLGI